MPDFDESAHARDDKGRFAAGEAAKSASSAAKAESKRQGDGADSARSTGQPGTAGFHHENAMGQVRAALAHHEAAAANVTASKEAPTPALAKKFGAAAEAHVKTAGEHEAKALDHAAKSDAAKPSDNPLSAFADKHAMTERKNGSGTADRVKELLTKRQQPKYGRDWG